MKYKEAKKGAERVFAISGAVTFQEEEVFQRLMAGVRNVPGHPLVLDLGGVEFIDSAGLGMLMIAKQQADDQGSALRLRGASGQVREMLRVTRFDMLIPCEA